MAGYGALSQTRVSRTEDEVTIFVKTKNDVEIFSNSMFNKKLDNLKTAKGYTNIVVKEDVNENLLLKKEIIANLKNLVGDLLEYKEI